MKVVLMKIVNRGKTKNYVTWDIALRSKDGGEFVAEFADHHKELADVALKAIRAHLTRKGFCKA